MQHLDRQLAFFRDRLCNEVDLKPEEVDKVATLVAADIRFLPPAAKAEIKAASPISLSARLEELIAFQSWSDFATSIRNNPAITRASVIVQNYICFVYLKDACFEVVAKRAAAGSVASRTAEYLLRGKVRDFRNAFSHANWSYNSTFTGLNCWVLEDARHRSGSMRHFEVSQDDLNFWQTLPRGIAYATYEQLREQSDTHHPAPQPSPRRAERLRFRRMSGIILLPLHRKPGLGYHTSVDINIVRGDRHG